jgi:hypothetical protein
VRTTVTSTELQDARRVITAKEAEDNLGIPAGTIRGWAATGKLLARSIGRNRQRWYLLSEVLELAGQTSRRVRHERPGRGRCGSPSGHIA